MSRATVIEKLTEFADSVMAAKGKDYTAGNWETDPNYNFNEISRLLQGAPINPYTVCMIYFLKHVFSLIKFCKTWTQEGGEGLEGRHVDALNYVRILWSLYVETYDRENLEYPDPDEVRRIVGPLPEVDYCNCPTCQRMNIRDAQVEQDRLDRVNELFNNNKQE